MLNAQYGYDTLSSASVYDWNSQHAQVQPTADKRITVCAIASNSIGIVETIIHEQLLFKKLRSVG
jgi:hypothetical protein